MTRQPSMCPVLGPLQAHVSGFHAYIQGLGYTHYGTAWQIWVMARFSAWLEETGVPLTDLREAHLEYFIADYRAQGYHPPIGRRRLRPLWQYLGEVGAVPRAEKTPSTPIEILVSTYRHFLHHRRNLTPQTIEGHIRTITRFLEWWTGDQETLQLDALRAHDVNTYLLMRTTQIRPGTAQAVLHRMRAFLRFLLQAGYVAQDIAIALPPVAHWRDTSQPPVVPAADIAAMLAHCDRTTVLGRRDYAILLLLIRLGLRASEVCQLTLDDCDWRAGELVISGKGRYIDRLPLPADVGTAMAEHLQQARPRASIRSVFVTLRAPHHTLTRHNVFSIVHAACRRAHITPIGPHRLRHALAANLVREGATLTAIGQVLRHRSVQSTAIYAKVDQSALRTVAQPWPEVLP